MEFLLKKIISTFLKPLPLGVGLILLSLFFISKNKPAKAKLTLILSVLWFFVISYTPPIDALLYDLESQNPTLHHAPKNVKYIYVLGSGHHTDNSHPITSQLSETAVVRLNEGLRHYHQLNKQAQIIVSGYHGLHDITEHAIMQKKLATSLGMKETEIILHLGTRDTEEEAQAGKALLDTKPFILVTSASHMTRALKIFRDAGLNPIAAPTNHLGNIKHPNYTHIFSANTLKKSHIIWHEYLGLVWQKCKELSSTFF